MCERYSEYDFLPIGGGLFIDIFGAFVRKERIFDDVRHLEEYVLIRSWFVPRTCCGLRVGVFVVAEAGLPSSLIGTATVRSVPIIRSRRVVAAAVGRIVILIVQVVV